MRGYLTLAAAGAASFSILSLHGAAAAQPARGAAHAWWYLGEQNAAPHRRLFFADRSSLTRRGDTASMRAALVFEQVEDGIKGFEVTYDFRCGAREQRTRNARFTQADGSMAGDQRPADPWQPAAPGSATEAVLDAACGGRFPAEAHSIAGLPVGEAQRIFASAAPVSRPGSEGLMSREALVQCMHAAGPESPACRNARASAARGRAAVQPQAPARSAAASGQQSYDRLLDDIVQEDSRAWQVNRYEPGSMRVVNVQRDARGNVTAIRGNYRYAANAATSSRLRGTILDPSLWGGIAPPSANAGEGWVEARFVGGRLQCLQYHDRSSCVASTRDYYQQANQAEVEHHEYCEITRNC